MPEDHTIRERISVLETEMRHLSRQVTSLTETVEELNALLQQASGAKWLIGVQLATGGVVGGFLVTWAPTLAKWILGVVK